MLIGYVSDENYVALADVVVDFELDGRYITTVSSTARGAIYANLESGTYRVTLQKPGYGSKRTTALVDLTPYTPPYTPSPSPPCPNGVRLLSDRLLGYMWPKWVKSGERAEFRVHSVEPYRLSLYRYGLRKEFIRLIGWFDAHGPRTAMQITPDGDYTRTGVKWNSEGYGSPHHTQFITAPERSGLYYLDAKTESGEYFSFPWVVAPTSPRAEIAVLASTNTWNAYNPFGGRSNYVNAKELPPEPTVNARQDLLRYRGGAYEEWRWPDEQYAPLSFDRPEPINHVPEYVEVTDPIAGRDACHVAPAEWRLLAWLEREGFDYDLYSESHLHSGELDLDSYRILILNAHPEYWSREMYERCKEWVFQHGGRLMYLGGNGINCEIEFLDDAAMHCKTQHVLTDPPDTSDPTDPTLRSRFARTVESEANLLGVVCTEAGIMTAAPYRVIDSSHWIFTGTGLASGDLFGTECLHERIPGGASGHETDKMSPSSPSNAVLLAKGLNPEDGGAEMVCIELDGGGAVFSAGSITYPASLLVDDQVSRITRNVIERFLE